MIFRIFLFACLATVNAQLRPVDPRGISQWNIGRSVITEVTPKSSTIIENKNVNIIVNVDPKDVARELFEMIQERLDTRQGRRSDDLEQTINDLEKVVTPVVLPTRRSHRPTAFEVAYALDNITRRALLSSHHTRSTIDDEIITRDIVARMLIKLKSITERDMAKSGKLNRTSSAFRRMQDEDINESESDESKSDDDEFLNINLKIRRSELLKHVQSSLENDS